MNVLITSASRKTGLVRAFQKALKVEGGGKVIAADMSPYSPALYLADEACLVPSMDSLGFLDHLLALCEEHGIKLIIPSRDEELLFFAEHRDDFAQIGITVMVADSQVIKTCLDKKMFLEFLIKHNIATPRTFDTVELSSAVFPLFVKPRVGKGGKGAILVSSMEELQVMKEKLSEIIIQERIEAPEYTIDLFADFTCRVISVVPRLRIGIFGGESFVGRTSKNQQLISESIRLAEALKLKGHNTIQCFFDGQTVKFIEVNPRYGGGATLGFAAGAFTPLYLVRLVSGKTVEPRIGDFIDNYVMLRYAEDIFLTEDELKK